jgi:hypothetical protein
MCFQSLLTQATSGIPSSHLYYHAFGVAALLEWAGPYLMDRRRQLWAVGFVAVVYVNSFLDVFAAVVKPRQNYLWFGGYETGNTMEEGPQREWVRSVLPGFDRQYMPVGFDSTMRSWTPVMTTYYKGKRVLNISELPGLGVVWGLASLPSGWPLWLDRGSSLYPKEEEQMNQSIEKREWDLVLYQDAHDNISPRTVELIGQNYLLVDSLESAHEDLFVRIYVRPGDSTVVKRGR